MISRRALLRGAAAVGVVGVVGERLIYCAGGTFGRSISYWVIDSSLDRKGEFRAAATSAGTPVSIIDRDIGRLAMTIDAAWAEQRRPIAGVTLPSGAFILERLALRHGMELSVVVEHRHRDGHWSHQLSLHPADARETFLAMEGKSWRAATVNALSRSVDRGATPASGARLNLSNLNAERWSGASRFVSWILQPLAADARRF